MRRWLLGKEISALQLKNIGNSAHLCCYEMFGTSSKHISRFSIESWKKMDLNSPKTTRRGNTSTCSIVVRAQDRCFINHTSAAGNSPRGSGLSRMALLHQNQ